MMVDWTHHEAEFPETLTDPDASYLLDTVFGSGGSDLSRKVAKCASDSRIDPWLLLGGVLVGTLAGCPPGFTGPKVGNLVAPLDVMFVSRMYSDDTKTMHPYRMAFPAVGAAPATIFTGLAQAVAYAAYQHLSPGIVINVCGVSGLMAEPLAPGYVKGAVIPPLLLPGRPAGMGRTVIVATADTDVSGMPERRRRALSQSVWLRGRKPASAVVITPTDLVSHVPRLVRQTSDFSMSITVEAEAEVMRERQKVVRFENVGQSSTGLVDSSTRLSVASLHALADDRRTVTVDDWAWSAGLIEHSNRVQKEANVPGLTDRDAGRIDGCSA